MFHRVVIAETERAFVYADGAFVRFLEPGTHWLVFPFRKITVRRVSTLEPKLTFADVEVLATHPEVAAKLDVVRIGDLERGLLFRAKNFIGFLGPGFHAFLRTPHVETRVEVVDVSGVEVTHPKRDVLVRATGAPAWIRTVEVADGHRAVLFLDWARERLLTPGRHYFWTGVKEIVAVAVDVREQTLEVQGQELMTQDKVSLRVNLTARFKVEDLLKVVDGQANWREAFYRELQLALRDEIGVRTLDALLTRKDEARAAILARVRPQAEAIGLTLLDAGLRDVILPGEMRTIFNQVIEAEKRAEAGLIARREETAATRNLLNTAKLLESNPTLMKLKELETTEKIAEKIGTLSVIGGLEGLMKALGSGVKLETK